MVNTLQKIDKAYTKLMNILNDLSINTRSIKKLFTRLYEINRQFAVEHKRYWYNRPTKYKDCVPYLKLFQKLIKEHSIIVNMKTFKDFMNYMYHRYNYNVNVIIINVSMNEQDQNINFLFKFYDIVTDLLVINRYQTFLDNVVQHCSNLSEAEALRRKKVVNHKLPQNLKNKIYSII